MGFNVDSAFLAITVVVAVIVVVGGVGGGVGIGKASQTLKRIR